MCEPVHEKIDLKKLDTLTPQPFAVLEHFLLAENESHFNMPF